MKCIVIDDEKLAIDLLERYLEKIDDLELVKTFYNPVEALAFLKQTRVDLIITDIQMPGLLGTELVKALKEKPFIIFTTAYRDYAIEGFELEVVDYLIKPFSFDRFLTAIGKVRQRSLSEQKVSEKPLFKRDYLTIKADHKLYRVKYDNIRYIEGMREYVSFYIDDKRITALMSLKFLEDSLPGDQFIRCHRSFIVNKDFVNAMEGNQLIVGAKTVPIGQSYKEKVVSAIF